MLSSWAGAPIELALCPTLGRCADRPGLVPIAGWGPRLSAGHMGPAEAAVACRRIGARWAVPVHWNTFYVPTTDMWPGDWMAAPGPKFVAALAREAPACRPLVLDLGGSVTIPTTSLGEVTDMTHAAETRRGRPGRGPRR